MNSKNFGRIARIALATTALMGAQWASAEVVAGTIVKFSDGIGSDSGGAFNGVVVSGADGTWNNSFQSFCLEYKENISFGTNYKVAGVTDHTVNKSGTYGTYRGSETGHTSTQDPISSQTAWLFTQFFNTGLSNSAIWGSGTQSVKNTAMQQAIWSLEGESFGKMSSLASNYVTLANEAVTSKAWSGIGNVRVLNLFSYNRYSNDYTTHAQDQLYMVSAVPEPETYALMLAGLGLVGTIARRRKAKIAAAS